MPTYDKKYSTFKQYFQKTPYNKLMQKRIREILVVCSQYDNFLLEEDCRIDEQIFQEYFSLNLPYPPRFTHVSTEADALDRLDSQQVDLIVFMLTIGEKKPFNTPCRFKHEYPHIPVVVLTYFNQEISREMQQDAIAKIKYIFSWLGNADLLMAVVKLLEDKMNLAVDVEDVGVQTIILVEDSIKYYSKYLPLIYKAIFQQARELMTEGLNEHQQTMRMRARPKILLATNYEDAIKLYNKYKKNLLGVITDISYKKDGKRDPIAGIKFCQHIRQEFDDLPILLQSSQEENRKYVESLNATFFNKNSKHLLQELKDYIKINYGFGDFLFIDPDTKKVIARAADLMSLQHKLKDIPNETIDYHVRRDHFGKWLKARIFFAIADFVKDRKYHDFENTDAARDFLIDTIKNYRLFDGSGTISRFNQERYDEYYKFARIGNGSLGGKGRSLAFMDSFLVKNRVTYEYDNISISIPRSIVLCIDIFEEFMESNNLYKIAFQDHIEDQSLLNHFILADFPTRVKNDLKAYLKVTNVPLAVRSSSLLEDSYYQPFAGVYKTYKLPNSDNNLNNRLRYLINAIKCVYASTYFKSAKAYMAATHCSLDEEKMAVIVQNITGSQYENRFYPTISGVARSLNFYPIEREKANEGIINIAMGLGKTVVDGEPCLRVSPKYSRKVIQLSDPKTALKSTQHKFYALNMDLKAFTPTNRPRDGLLHLDIKEAENDGTLKYIASTYDHKNEIIRDAITKRSKKIITFSGILKNKMLPLTDIIIHLLEIGQEVMNTPIEMEFAFDLNPGEDNNFKFHVLQMRPIVEGMETQDVKISQEQKDNSIIYAKKALGNGSYNDIYDFIYIKPDRFHPSKTKIIASQLGELNEKLKKENRPYILVGPGRWGSNDPWLGIPIKWEHITNAKVIIESSIKGYHIDASQGSHFFHNITSFKIIYLTLNPHINDGHYDLDYLQSIEPFFENDYFKHIRSANPFITKVNGKEKEAVILKPDG